MSTTSLRAKPTLKDIQEYVARAVVERGFGSETLKDSFIMLTEEVGELAKEVRKHNGVAVATDSTLTDIEEEAADVLWMLICVCNHLDIDLERAFRAKETKNQTRTWR